MMAGRIRRRLAERALAEAASGVAAGSPGSVAQETCALCGRPVLPRQRDAHHWIPRSHGGRVTGVLHRVCHRQVHALLSEAELARHYASPEALLAHPQLSAFVRWVRGKPLDFEVRTRKSQRLRSR
jgi:hypothetical protein